MISERYLHVIYRYTTKQFLLVLHFFKNTLHITHYFFLLQNSECQSIMKVATRID
jgi:hypothetical protein